MGKGNRDRDQDRDQNTECKSGTYVTGSGKIDHVHTSIEIPLIVATLMHYPDTT